MLLFILSGRARMLPLFVRQQVQKFSHRSVGRPARGPRIEPAGLHLHYFRLSPRHFHAQRPHHPYRPPLQKPAHVLAPNRRNVIPKLLAEHRQKAVPVPGLFRAHLFEHFGCGGIGFAQRIGKFAVNPSILFLTGNGQSQNLFLRQVLESLEYHGASSEIEAREWHSWSAEANDGKPSKGAVLEISADEFDLVLSYYHPVPESATFSGYGIAIGFLRLPDYL